MCEQTSIDYRDGDIVWVKLGPCWWPGEVNEVKSLPDGWLNEFRKPPITTVKFFDEDAYEYVRSIDKIYSYNCTRKNEFIKKGLDLYRAKNSFMDKFPADVSTAEKRTDGDPNIIDSPIFSPEKKTNFAALLFGASKPKKTPRKSGGGNKRPSSGSSTTLSPSGSSKAISSSRMITHPRFLGRDDHEVRILVQSPEKTEVVEQERESSYNCTSCGFTTSRIDVIVLHNKSHIQGVYSTPTSTIKKGKKPPQKRGKKVLKMTRSKTSSIIEDLALIEKGLLLSTESSDEEMAEVEWDAEPKRKRKKNKRKPKKVLTKKEQETTKIDIRDNLLAEWGDDSEEAEEDTNLNTSSTAESDTSMNKVEESNKTDNKIDDTKKDSEKSCFDFEEEEDNEIIGTSVGRKIPRVIPHTDRQKTVDPDVSEANLPTAEDDINRNEQIKEVNDVAKEVDVVDKEVEMAFEEDKTENSEVDAFKDILEATAVPDLPEIPHSLKFEQNFHNARTIKFPDKSATELSIDDKSVVSKPETKEVIETATKLINPKKRFVKSFEDFEQQWNSEQKKITNSEEQVLSEHTSGQHHSEHKSEQQHSERKSEQQHSEHKSEQQHSEHKSEQQHSEHKSEQQYSEHKSEQQHSEHKSAQQHSEYKSEQQHSEHKSEQQYSEYKSEQQHSEHKSEQQHSEHKSEQQHSEHKSEQQHSEHKSEQQHSEHKSEQQHSEQISEQQHSEQISEQQLNNMPDQITNSDEQLNSEDAKLIDYEKQLSNDETELEPELIKHGRKFTEVEQQPEKLASIVEVSKLKTQLMSKLESAEKLLPIEQSRSKRLETPRQSRSLRERILEKQKEENMDELWYNKKTVANKSYLNESLSPKSKCSESVRPKSPHEAKTYEVNEIQKLQDETIHLNLNAPTLSVEKSLHKDATLDNITTESKFKSYAKLPSAKSRRLSIKMPEVEVTQEIEQTAELLELEQTRLLQAEQAKVLEVQQSTEIPQVEQVITETPKTESQIPVQLDSQPNELFEKKLEDEIELNREQSNSRFGYSDSYDSTIMSTEDNQQKTLEKGLMPLSDMYTENELHKTEEQTVKNVETKPTGKHHLSKREAPPETEMDEFMCAPFKSVNVDQDIQKNIDSELNSNIQEACGKTEYRSSSFRIENTDSEDLSALSTLAAVSELTTNLDIQGSSHDEKSKIIEGNLASVSDIASSIELNTSSSEKSKVVEGNLTFVTEDDLADGQVEIADISSVDKHKNKPITLSSFSVDFTDPNHSVDRHVSHSNDMHKVSTETSLATNTVHKTNKRKYEYVDQSEIIEKSLEKVFEEEMHCNTTPNVHSSKNMKLTNVAKGDGKNSLNIQDENNCDIEDQIPSLVVCSTKQPDIKNVLPKTNYLEKSRDHPEYTSSSKLLEILTDGKPKSTKIETVTSQKSPNIFDMSPQSSRKIDSKLPTVLSKEAKIISKFDPKNSKFVIKSTIPGKSNVMPIPSKSNKPIILSEKIIKPVSETESVSVQKVTSKRSNQDIEDIDTFIIQKPAKKMMVSTDSDLNESVPVSNQTIKKLSASRGKAKILQQTIIKPAAEVIQPTTALPVTATFSGAATTISQTPIDDNMFDINSMPIVLGDQILTAESIENLPVVLSDSIHSTKSVPTATTASKSQNDQIKLLNKSTTAVTTQSMLVKTYSSQKLGKSPRLFQTSTTKVVKSNPAIITRTGKSDKFIIVPSGSSTPTGSKYTVGKRPSVMKRSAPVILPTPNSGTKVQTAPSSEPTGNKIMIVTNQQGRQSRVLLTPAQQKLLGYQATGSKLVKNTLKGNILQKASNIKSSGLSPLTNISSAKVPSMISHALVNSKGEVIPASTQNLITSDGQVLMPVKSQQIRSLKPETPKGGRKIQMQSQKVLLQEGLNALKGSTIPGQQKTIVIKNQQGQIVKKFHGTDDALLEQQVAEQVQAIKASGSFSSMKARQEISASKIKPAIRRSYPKKVSTVETTRSGNKTQMVLNTSVGFTPSKLQKSEAVVPPLAPISPKRSDTLLLSQSVSKMDETKVVASSTLKDVTKPEQLQKPLNQLIIQDALGNQTTITEGQILALPSGETVDGQPQSYMLVTLDESGNLAPLNNEALLSLDPNLCLGGDLSNMVLQIDEGTVTAKQDNTDNSKISATSASTTVAKASVAPQSSEIIQKETQQPSLTVPVAQEQLVEDKSVVSENVNITNENSGLLPTPESVDNSQQNLETMQTVTCSIGSDPNQQLIITGDPISAQKFIESLAEGNPDLANLLASAEGNILIQTDEQQILINTDAENQVLMPVNENTGAIENSEGDGNPIFATQPTKNQDILAAALADTDVFQQEQTASPAQTKVSQSQLSPNSGLYPSGVSNVLGTTLSLSSPIMTPLEVPSSNSKKIPDDEMDILTSEVPKNVDLPITITDPNISQTVAQQQVASLIASELTSNLDLPLTISDQGVPLTSSEMNSPSYVYSLPSLDESVDIHPKTFSGPISMPLLNEEPQDATAADSNVSEIDSKRRLSEIGDEKETVSNLSEVDIQTTPSDSTLHTSSVSEVSTLFETSTLTTSDNIKDNENLQSSSRTFMGTTIETEEGLCTLGGAMCSSLSEPPPDMFDLSVVNTNYRSETTIKEHTSMPEVSIGSDVSESASASCQSKVDCNLEVNLSINEQNTTSVEDYDKYESYDTESRNDSTPLSNLPLNSESSSPAVNIDENSCEIPVQPQIITDLSSSSFETHETTDSTDFDSHKKISADDGIENEKKKIKFD